MTTTTKTKKPRKNWGFVASLKERSTFIPRDYQTQAKDFLLSRNRAGLFAAPGAGKTAATLLALTDAEALNQLNRELLKEREGTDRPIPKLDLIIAPLRVCRLTWPAEANQWSFAEGYYILNFAGLTKSQRMKAWADIQYYSAVAINIDGLKALLEFLFETYGQNYRFEDIFRRMVYDECSELRSFQLPGIIPYRNGKLAIDKLRAKGPKLSPMLFFATQNLRRVWLLSGTPTPNGMENLHGLTLFTDCQLTYLYKKDGVDYYSAQSKSLGKKFAYMTAYFDHEEGSRYNPETREKEFFKHNYTLKPGAFERIIERTKELYITIDPRDELDIQKPVVNLIRIQLPEAAMKQYKGLERELIAIIDNVEIAAKTRGAAHAKLLQVTNGHVYDENKEIVVVHDEKLNALTDLVNELNGEPLLIIYNLKSDVLRIQKKFPEARLLKSDDDFNDWNKRKVKLGLIHPASAGHGLSLQHGGHHMCFFGMTYDLELFLQVRERIGPLRQLASGYNRLVYEHYLIAENTIDERALDRLAEKDDLMTKLLKAFKEKNS